MASKARNWVANPTVTTIDFDAAARSRERIANEILASAGTKNKKKKRGFSVREFYQSKEWKRVRYLVLKRSNGRCQCCGVGPNEGAVLNVDHIKSLTKRPDLATKLSNLQVLCAACNTGKGWRDETDWRIA